jgi:hypothetical protein
MENAYHASYKWEKEDSIFVPIIGQEATLLSFPFDNCYSRRSWDLLVWVATLINRELTMLILPVGLSSPACHFHVCGRSMHHRTLVARRITHSRTNRF